MSSMVRNTGGWISSGVGVDGAGSVGTEGGGAGSVGTEGRPTVWACAGRISTGVTGRMAMLMNMDTITNRLVRRFILFPPFGISNGNDERPYHSQKSLRRVGDDGPRRLESSGLLLPLSKVRARSGASLRFGGLVSGRAHNEP